MSQTVRTVDVTLAPVGGLQPSSWRRGAACAAGARQARHCCAGEDFKIVVCHASGVRRMLRDRRQTHLNDWWLCLAVGNDWFANALVEV